MKLNPSDLSATARTIHDLVGDGKIGPVLQQHPELLAGLDEYVRWREGNAREVAQVSATPAIGHSLVPPRKK